MPYRSQVNSFHRVTILYDHKPKSLETPDRFSSNIKKWPKTEIRKLSGRKKWFLLLRIVEALLTGRLTPLQFPSKELKMCRLCWWQWQTLTNHGLWSDDNNCSVRRCGALPKLLGLSVRQMPYNILASACDWQLCFKETFFPVIAQCRWRSIIPKCIRTSLEKNLISCVYFII